MAKYKKNLKRYKNLRLSHFAVIMMCLFLIGNASAMGTTYEDVKFMGNIYGYGNLSIEDITVRSGQSITLASSTFENFGHYTTINENFVVKDNDQPAAFLGVMAMNQSTSNTASLVLDAFGSTFNIIKTSPLANYWINYSMIINDGSHFTMVGYDDTIGWGHFTSLDQDQYGNILNVTGLDSHMLLTHDSLDLSDIDLNVNGSVNVGGIIYGDGSGLTNINKSHSSNWIQNGDNIYYNNGNVAIGINSTYTPTYPLEVQSQHRLSPALFIKPFEWDSSGDYAIIHLGDVNNYIKSEYSQGIKISSNWGTRIYQGTTERVHILGVYTRFFSPDGTPEITLNDGRLDLSGPLNIRDSWWGIDLSNIIGFRIQDGANKERSLIDGVKNKWISPDATNNLTLNNSGIFVTGDLDVSGDLEVSGSLTLIGNLTDDLTLDANQHFSVADSKIYSSDDNGYLQFGTDGDISWWDVGNSAIRLNINWLGTYVSSPTDIVSAQITDTAFAVSYSGNEIQIEIDSTDTLLRSPNGVNKFNLNNTGASVTGGLDVSGNIDVSGVFLGDIIKKKIYNVEKVYSFNPSTTTTKYTQYLGTFDLASPVEIQLYDGGPNHGASTFVRITRHYGQPPAIEIMNDGTWVAGPTFFYRLNSPTEYELFFMDNSLGDYTVFYTAYIDYQGTVGTSCDQDDTNIEAIAKIGVYTNGFTGRVGIGTQDPNHQLEVAGHALLSGDGSTAQINFIDTYNYIKSTLGGVMDIEAYNGIHFSEAGFADTLTIDDGVVAIQDLAGTYTGGSAHVCVYNNGTLFSSESACP